MRSRAVLHVRCTWPQARGGQHGNKHHGCVFQGWSDSGGEENPALFQTYMHNGHRNPWHHSQAQSSCLFMETSPVSCLDLLPVSCFQADSRTSTGSYIANRVTDKITPLADNVYILRSGSAADTQAIASYVQMYIAQHQAEANERIRVKIAANMAMQLAYSNKDMLQVSAWGLGQWASLA